MVLHIQCFLWVAKLVAGRCHTVCCSVTSPLWWLPARWSQWTVQVRRNDGKNWLRSRSSGGSNPWYLGVEKLESVQRSATYFRWRSRPDRVDRQWLATFDADCAAVLRLCQTKTQCAYDLTEPDILAADCARLPQSCGRPPTDERVVLAADISLLAARYSVSNNGSEPRARIVIGRWGATMPAIAFSLVLYRGLWSNGLINLQIAKPLFR